MSGFPWTSLITAVVPAAAVLAGAVLNSRLTKQAGQTAALKADYAAFVQAVTALIERLHEAANRRDDDPGPADLPQLASAVALARALVDLAGSYGARQAASNVSRAAFRATKASGRADWLDQTGYGSARASEAPADDAPAGAELREALDDFLRAVRTEVGGESRPQLKWVMRRAARFWMWRILPRRFGPPRL